MPRHVPLARASRRYDKLSKKYPTVGCCAGNDFGFGLDDIDTGAELAGCGEAERDAKAGKAE